MGMGCVCCVSFLTCCLTWDVQVSNGDVDMKEEDEEKKPDVHARDFAEKDSDCHWSFLNYWETTSHPVV